MRFEAKHIVKLKKSIGKEISDDNMGYFIGIFNIYILFLFLFLFLIDYSYNLMKINNFYENKKYIDTQYFIEYNYSK